MNARKLHRTTMTVCALFILCSVITGLTLAIFDATDRHQAWALLGGGPGARLHDDADQARSVPAPATLAGGIGRALAAAGQMPIAGVDYRMIGDIPRLELSEADGRRDTELRYYAQSGQPMTPLVADGDPFQPQPSYTALRERLKSFHKGDFLGLPGQFVSLLNGAALTLLALSGVYLYLRLWQARRKAGRTELFWTARESLWRRLHRTIAIVAAIFVLNKALTGIILAWAEMQVQLAVVHHAIPFPYPMPTPLPPYSEGPLPGDPLRALETSYEAAQAAELGAPIVAIELVRHGGQPRSLVTVGGAQPHTLAFDLRTAAPAEDWATQGTQLGNGYFADWHQVLKRMHRGDIIGRFSGRYLDIGVGVVTLYLVISGTVLYAQMLGRRRLSGQTGLFWK
jgi:uncharacterized iron-regulated membrane protein